MRYESLDDVARLVGSRLIGLAPNPVVVARLVGVVGAGSTPLVLVDVGWERRVASFAVPRPVQLGYYCHAVRRGGGVTAPLDVITTNYRLGPAYFGWGSALGQGPVPPGTPYLPGDSTGTGTTSPTDPGAAWDQGSYPSGLPMGLGVGVVP